MPVTTSVPLGVRAVTIDLDGTLADTVPDIAAAVDAMLGELGRPAIGPDRVRTYVGKGMHRLIERVLAGSLDGAATPELFARAVPIFERH